MKLIDIKTEEHFWCLAENWYQRTIKLANIQYSDASDYKKEKAFKLWIIMIRRMTYINVKAIEIMTNKNVKFPLGGIINNIN